MRTFHTQAANKCLLFNRTLTDTHWFGYFSEARMLIHVTLVAGHSITTYYGVPLCRPGHFSTCGPPYGRGGETGNLVLHNPNLRHKKSGF